MPKTITFEELLEPFKETPMQHRCRKKDGEPMYRHGKPVMIETSGEKTVPAETLAALNTLLATADVAGLALYQNVDMWSSQIGASTAVPYGPKRLFKLESLPQWINDLPSQRQYLQAIYPNPQFTAKESS